MTGDSSECPSTGLRSCQRQTPARGRRALARLALARLLVRFFYGCAASLNAAHGLRNAVPETDLAAPTRPEFAALLKRRGLSDGAPGAAAPELPRAPSLSPALIADELGRLAAASPAAAM